MEKSSKENLSQSQGYEGEFSRRYIINSDSKLKSYQIANRI